MTLSRRDFLKLISLVSAAQVAKPLSIIEPIHRLAEPDAPNFLFLVFDTLAAAHTSLHGYQRETTPNLARMAERATVFHNHHAAGNFTSPGTASMLTGTYPWSHRAFHLHGTVDESRVGHNIFEVFARKGYYQLGYSHNDLVTSLLHQFKGSIDQLMRTRELGLATDQIADLLFNEDFTPAYLGEWQYFRRGKFPPSSLLLSWVHRLFRFGQKKGFERELKELFPVGVPNLNNFTFVLEDAIDWLKGAVHSLAKPFFMYIHLLPPHEPYRPRRDFTEAFRDGWTPASKPNHQLSPGLSPRELANQRRAYDQYLAYTDAEFGRLYDSLEKSGELKNTYLIFTSDHGQSFERGIHGHVTPVLYQPLLNVPLLIASPGQQARKDVYSPTSAVDLLPTLSTLIGEPVPEWAEGEILPTFAERAPDPERAIFSVEAKSNPKGAPLEKATISMIKGDHKMIHYYGFPKLVEDVELYNLAADPEENLNLFPLTPSKSQQMEDELAEKLWRVNEPFQKS